MGERQWDHVISIRVTRALFEGFTRVCNDAKLSKNRYLIGLMESAVNAESDGRMFVVALPDDPRPPVHLESGRIHFSEASAKQRAEQIRRSAVSGSAYVLEVTEADLDEEQLQWLAARKTP